MSPIRNLPTGDVELTRAQAGIDLAQYATALLVFTPHIANAIAKRWGLTDYAPDVVCDILDRFARGESQTVAARCTDCRDEIETVNVEAFELTGRLLCDDCADAVFGAGDDEDDPRIGDPI